MMNSNEIINNGTNIWLFPKIVGPKSSILIGFSIINHPFWGTTIFGNIHIYIYECIWVLPFGLIIRWPGSPHVKLMIDAKLKQLVNNFSISSNLSENQTLFRFELHHMNHMCQLVSPFFSLFHSFSTTSPTLWVSGPVNRIPAQLKTTATSWPALPASGQCDDEGKATTSWNLRWPLWKIHHIRTWQKIYIT